MIVEGYELHLYCDYGPHGYKQGTGQFTGDSKSSTRRSAKSHGWLIRRVNGVETVKCPECIKNKCIVIHRLWG